MTNYETNEHHRACSFSENLRFPGENEHFCKTDKKAREEHIEHT